MSLVSLTQFEDDIGTCDTCPGELDTPESVYMRDPVPPAYPWRALGAACAVLFSVPLLAHLFARFWPYVEQVAAR